MAGAVRILPENSVAYMLFTIGASHTSKPLARLEQVRKAAVQLSGRLTRDHIWQKDVFSLQTLSQKGLVYLYGITEYGDAVEDEWLIVYMLRELSRSFPDVWIRVWDADGEFLLVEGAKSVPRWLDPEIDAHRVWIHDGHLNILPPEGMHTPGITGPGRAPEPGLLRSITLEDAIRAIRSRPETLLRLPDLESEAFYRLGKYPASIKDSIHHARVVLPRKLAYILHRYPQAIAQAVEAFHYRDPVLMKRLFRSGRMDSLLFPPEDLVNVSVKFTRVLYAQLRAQRFRPPDSWSSEFALYTTVKGSPGPANKDKVPGDGGDDEGMGVMNSMANLGMKITCGFELMAAVAESNNNRTVREIGLVLEDLQEVGDGAVDVLPTDDEIKTWTDVDRDDDDSWLEIGFSDLERELDRGMSMGSSASKQTSDSVGPESSGFGDARMQADLRKIVSRFQDFLNDNDAGIEGAQIDEMDENDDTSNEEGSDEEDGDTSSPGEGNGICFDEEEFSRLMRELVDPHSSDGRGDAPVPTEKGTGRMGNHGEPSANISMTEDPAGSSRRHKSDKKGDVDDDDDEQSILELAAQFEKELQGYGALSLGGAMEEKAKHIEVTSRGKDASGSVTGVPASSRPGTSGQTQDEVMDDSDGEVNIDVNLAKNLLESFKGQAGMAGPAGNILSMMGLSLPRDEDEDEDKEDGDDGDRNGPRHDKRR